MKKRVFVIGALIAGAAANAFWTYVNIFDSKENERTRKVFEQRENDLRKKENDQWKLDSIKWWVRHIDDVLMDNIYDIKRKVTDIDCKLSKNIGPDEKIEVDLAQLKQKLQKLQQLDDISQKDVSPKKESDMDRVFDDPIDDDDDFDFDGFEPVPFLSSDDDGDPAKLGDGDPSDLV